MLADDERIDGRRDDRNLGQRHRQRARHPGAGTTRHRGRSRQRAGRALRRRRLHRGCRSRHAGSPPPEHHHGRRGGLRPDRRGAPPGGRVVGDGLRRVGQQPGPADRGRAAATGQRVRLRAPAGDGRADGRRVATRPARTHRGGAAAGHRAGRQRHQRPGASAGCRTGSAVRRRRSAVAVPAPRRSGQCGDAGGRAVARRSLQRRARRLRPGGVGSCPVGRGAQAAAARSPGRGRQLAALALPARPDPAGPAQLHPLAVAGGQRSAEGPRVAPDGDQRAGLRRGDRGEVVDDDHAQAPPRAVAGRHGAGWCDGGGGRRGGHTAGS